MYFRFCGWRHDIIERIRRIRDDGTRIFPRVRQVAAAGTKSVVSNCILLALRHRDAEWLIFYRCGFSLFLLSFQRLISEVTERISTKFWHIFTDDCYLKNLVWTPPGHLIAPTGWGKKNAFLDRFWTFTVKYLCNGRWYQQPETNLSIYMDSLNAPKFGEL